MNKIAVVPQESFDLDAAIEGIAQAQSSFDIFKYLKSAGAAFGLPRFLVTTNRTSAPRKFVQRVVITNWDAELLARFVEADLMDRSMLAEALRQCSGPVTISLAESAGKEDPAILEELREMIARGYDRTAYFPFVLPGSKTGAVSFAGLRGPLRAGEMAELGYTAWHAFLRLAEVATIETPHNPLSEREISVFRRIADGLTADEIGRDLGITSHTVNYHIANTTHKLGVKNKTQALVTLLQNGWLAMEAP